MDDLEMPVEDVDTILGLLGRLETKGGQLIIGKSGEHWTVAMVTKHEDAEEMSVSGFSTGDDLSKVLDDVADELEMF